MTPEEMLEHNKLFVKKAQEESERLNGLIDKLNFKQAEYDTRWLAVEQREIRVADRVNMVERAVQRLAQQRREHQAEVAKFLEDSRDAAIAAMALVMENTHRCRIGRIRLKAAKPKRGRK